MQKDLNRKLVAIMFTDMVGFTALMQRDERLGLEKRNRHKQVFEAQHQSFKGEIIQYFGDGTLSIFNNSIDAITCAIEIQKELRAPVEVPLRIGIHSGNVVIEDDGIIGDAVNIASRIESFANIGGVLISDAVLDQVKNQAHWSFVSLGKFSLQNVERPFEIFAVASEGLVVPDPDFLHGKGEKFAILKSFIPVPATPLLGREKEVKELIGLLDTQKIVTLTGTGGMGKTRLALEICHLIKPVYQDGIAFVSMATLTDATEVMPTLAAALDIKDAEGRGLIEGVAALVSDKKALLVLDNLEHVISAAQEIAELSSHCPNLKILCTSRTPLKIKAEQEYALLPLPLPEKSDHSSLMTYPSIQLFVDRAKRVNKDFELTEDNAIAVTEICHRMDGLPLALELAAARIRILSPEKLLDRLGRALDLLTTGSKDLPERHQTLRATIDWSHSLLNKEEQQLFRRLAAFSGGFTQEAIEACCYENENAAFSALDELESLLDKGLIVNMDAGNRFSFLQTIKDFAMEKLKAAGEEEMIFQKHADYYLEIAKTLHLGTQGDKQLARMYQGALEENNIQTALDFLLSKANEGDENAREKGLTICGELWMYWHIRGKHVSAEAFANAFLKGAKDEKPTLGKSKSLLTLGLAYWTLGKHEKCLETALMHYAIATELEDELEMAKASFNVLLGYIYLNLEKAAIYSREAIERFQKLGSEYWLSMIFFTDGLIKLMSGNLKEAGASFNESLQFQQKTGDNEVKGGSLSCLALLDAIDENYERAIELYQQSLAAYEAVGDRPEEARILSELSWTYLAIKNTTAARKYVLDSIQAYQEVGSMRGVGISMNGLAAIESVEGRPVNAIEIASAAEHFAEQEGIVNEYGLNNAGKIYLDNAKKELSPEEIERAVKSGRQLSVKEVLRMAENNPILII
ncbi:MAG: tetratricopeptide repeat protein [Haliscomenobacter sp.]|nr:tetratricopeptide repeat protein [Haliscomenobacter sp.]